MEVSMKKYISILLIVSIMTIGITACSKPKTVKTSVSPKGTLSEIINKIYEKKDPMLKLQTIVPDFSDSDNLKYYTYVSCNLLNLQKKESAMHF
jgi:hypothetical protein